MRPLSPFKYIKSNKKKVLPISLSVCLGVFLIYFLSMIIGEVNLTIKSAFSIPLSKYSIILPSGENAIPDAIIKRLQSDSSVREMIPAICDPYGIHKTMVASSLGTSVLFLRVPDINQMMNEINIKLIKGRLPEAGKNEIIVNIKILKNKGLKIGDQVGSEIDPIDSIQGKYTIVGILDGQSIISIASYPADSNLNSDYLLKQGLLILPGAGRIGEVNSILGELSSKDILRLTYDEVQPALLVRMNMLNTTIYLLELLVIIVLCISLGNISYINFYQRRREFGVLSAIGYSRRSLYRKIWIEMGFTSFSGYIFGILFSLLVGWMLNTSLWEPRGQYMPLWNTTNVLIIIFVPLFVNVFSVLPAVRTFKKTDPILIIEGVA